MFLQYLGLFRKVLRSDIFVVYDTAQYSKNDWHNRNKIKTKYGAEWLTVPVSYHLGDSFRVAKPTNNTFVQSHLDILKQAYGQAPFFKELFPVLEKAYRKPFTSLADFNWNLQSEILKLLNITPKIIFSSKLDLAATRGTEALVRMCTMVGADTYLAGMDAGYMDTELFERKGITLLTNDFVAKPYPQQWGAEFIPNLSVVDALFNVGPIKTRELIA